MSRLKNFPQDILLHILRDVVQSQQSNIVFPECQQKDSPHQMKIYYPHSRVTSRYGRKFRAKSHWELVRVWLALNTTCRFMRRIGTEAWYDIVQFAMYSSLPQRLRAHRGEPTQLSLRLHLARIKNLILVDHYAGSPTKLLALPRCLNFFSRLRSCTLVYKYVISRERNGVKPDLPYHRVYRTLEKAVTNPPC
ncbi:hypothetical protein PG991_013934 [Apiospora marii]|uniref:Uncharacterized protein n=1 Tax=Apiospora marii TaxID=335849 RepID=A0ABR1R875_9PEZI